MRRRRRIRRPALRAILARNSLFASKPLSWTVVLFFGEHFTFGGQPIVHVTARSTAAIAVPKVRALRNLLSQLPVVGWVRHTQPLRSSGAMVVPLRDRQRTTCFVLHESIDCVISDTDHVTLAESAHSVEHTEASQIYRGIAADVECTCKTAGHEEPFASVAGGIELAATEDINPQDPRLITLVSILGRLTCGMVIADDCMKRKRR